MKRLLLIAVLLHSFALAGPDNALFDLDINSDKIIASGAAKRSTLGTSDVLSLHFRFGYALADNQNLYVSKGGVISNVPKEDITSLTPADYTFATEQIGYEYILDFGASIDIGAALNVGDLIIADGNNTTGLVLAGEAQIFAIINMTKNIRFQFGYGKRFTNLDDSDLTALNLTKAQVDTNVYTFVFDIGGF